MPTSYYTLREKETDYKIQTPYSKEALQWLDYVARENDIKIRHAENNLHGEKRIDDFKVDDFPTCDTVYLESSFLFMIKCSLSLF